MIQETYQKLLTTLKTKSVSRLWEQTENKTSKEAAQIIYEIVKAFAELSDEITGQTSDIIKCRLIDFRQNKKKFVQETDTDYVINCKMESEVPVQTTYSLKKSCLENTYEEMCSSALVSIEGRRSEIQHNRKVCKDKISEFRHNIDKYDEELYKISLIEDAIKTETGGPRDIILANRYASDVRLRMHGSNTKWKFVVPSADAQFVQLSYEGDVNNPKYTSIDPPGGPYLTIGKNVIRPYLMKETIEINIKKITFEDGSYFLETDPIEDFKIETV